MSCQHLILRRIAQEKAPMNKRESALTDDVNNMSQQAREGLVKQDRIWQVLGTIIVGLLLVLMFIAVKVALISQALSHSIYYWAVVFTLIWPILHLCASLRGYLKVRCWLFGHKTNGTSIYFSAKRSVSFCSRCSVRTSLCDHE